MKVNRHAKIIELINKYHIETQEELAEYLNQEGFKVTQATVSRDIRDLKLTKIPSENGKQRYALHQHNENGMSEKYIRVLREGYLSMDMAQNILVIKTVAGMASAVCAALDAMKWNEIVGSIAGDDTIMCAIRSVDDTVKSNGQDQQDYLIGGCMLQYLHVKNLALIDEIEVEFGRGLNILTGETGAGKSIILGSVNLALGGRYTKDILRQGARYGLVELTFSVENERQIRKLKELDIYPEDGFITLQRRLMEGRSVSKINGETVQMATLKSSIIDFDRYSRTA